MNQFANKFYNDQHTLVNTYSTAGKQWRLSVTVTTDIPSPGAVFEQLHSKLSPAIILRVSGNRFQERFDPTLYISDRVFNHIFDIVSLCQRF